MRLCIDLMGSESTPHDLFPALLKSTECLGPKICLIALATPRVKRKLLSVYSLPTNGRIDIHEVSEIVPMDENPLSAIKSRKKTSIFLGMNLLKQGKVDAFISCGNTGALMASARVHLSKMKGVIRPALLIALPSQKKSVSVLDVGGNVSCTAQHLVSFARLGAVYHHVAHAVSLPRVGLLNIGVEEMKGTAEIRKARELLTAYCESETQVKGCVQYMQFKGNVEARDVFSGNVDVLVTDGFTGNILLKTAEGVSSFILESVSPYLEEEISNKLHHQFNHTEYPGALLCGVKGIVVKAHGNTTAASLLSSILYAAHHVKNQLIEKMEKVLIGESGY